MPRPPAKRSRRLASQSQPISTAQDTKPTRQDVLRANENVNSNSDDSDGLVTAVHGRRNSGTARREVFMSGGLGKGDTKNAHKTNQTNMRDASSPLRTTGSKEMQRGRSQTPVSKSHEQAIESSPMTESVATGSRPPTRARGYSSTLSLAGRKGDMSSRVPGTPAFESSMLSNFRRRPRQPSILQMMQADGSSDLDDDDDFLGSLSPEDESTPLNLARKSLISKPLATSPSTPSLPSSGSSRKRKRTPEEVQVPQSPPGFVEDSPKAASVPGSDKDEASASHEELPAAPVDPEAFSQTMALPLSSSPVSTLHEIVEVPRQVGSRSAKERVEKSTVEADEKAVDPRVQLSTAALQEKFLPRRRRQHRNRGTDFDFPSDDSEVDSVRSDDDELSYLPSRRSRRRALGESKGASNTKVKSKRTGRDGRKNTHGTNTGTSTATASSAAKTSKVSEPRDRITYSSRYRRDPERDKENQLSDTSSSLSSPPASEELASDPETPTSKPLGRFLSKELEFQAKKFAEIDKWQMEFEDVMVSGSQCSPSR
ncbi:hypothetical protein VTN00DRAFT_2484 [Thermoascus crustaceus]|uniref:uncharacterized protein n=1 Tax=Thermoascus crustaceus TaxID=5088 RepID=UPI003744532E